MCSLVCVPLLFGCVLISAAHQLQLISSLLNNVANYQTGEISLAGSLSSVVGIPLSKSFLPFFMVTKFVELSTNCFGSITSSADPSS